MSNTLVNINALEQDRSIELDGKTHAVKPVTARMLGIIRGAGDEVEKLVTVVDLAAPTIGRERLLDLTPEQLSAILGVAQEAVQEVEAADPNGAAPATSTTQTASPA